MRTFRVVVLCLSVAALLTPAPALALPLQPLDLLPGESYHWFFITRGTMTSTSNDIADYNAFVNAEAALNPDLSGLTWHAVASTESIDARVNAPISGPVYFLDGRRFQDGFLEMWDGSNVGTLVPRIDQFGLDRPVDPLPWVWTGTDVDGTVHAQGLGGAAHNWAGQYTSTFASWIFSSHFSATVEFPLYALSSPIKAQAVPPVPEPAMCALLAIALGSTAFRRRRQRIRSGTR